MKKMNYELIQILNFRHIDKLLKYNNKESLNEYYVLSLIFDLNYNLDIKKPEKDLTYKYIYNDKYYLIEYISEDNIINLTLLNIENEDTKL